MIASRMNRAFVPLTTRDQDLSKVLGLCVPLMTVDQVRRGWWPGSRTSAACERRLSLLQGKELVVCSSTMTVPPPPLCGPLVVWRPGQKIPDFGPALAEARRRARKRASSVPVVWACFATCARLGTIVRSFRPSDVAHDLLLAEVFLAHKKANTGITEVWRGGMGQACRAGLRVSDAVLTRPGRPLHIEVVGSSYSRTKLTVLHWFCADRDTEYQLW